MADIFDEINEELKQDRMSALWARYGKYLIAVAGLVIAVVVFTQTYKQWQASQNEQAAETFYQAMMGDDAAAAFELGRDDLTEGYQMLADFKIASDKANSGDKQAAEELYLALSENDDIAPLYRDLALLLAAMNVPDSRTADDIIAMLVPLTQGSGPFQGLALEAAAGADVQAGRIEAAKEKLGQIEQLADISAPLRQRSVELKKILGER
ncbi:MAG: hypothetical protein CMN52_02775 [SAR116 cluster bacterium]|nr:hypothetical protein [SAR116 cluster bacterium]